MGTLLQRLKVCWHVLSNKEFYCVVITDRYSDGQELESEVLSHTRDTETAIKRLQRELKTHLFLLKQEKKGG